MQPSHLKYTCRVMDGAEISMEADPGTFDASRIREYMALGVSRFSIGVQAFQQVTTMPAAFILRADELSGIVTLFIIQHDGQGCDALHVSCSVRTNVTTL